jgi:thioredoxin 1
MLLFVSDAQPKEGHREMAEGITTVTDTTFDETIGSAAEPVVVDFWAEWCGPCKMIAPILDEIASEHAGKLSVAKLNVDENPDIARRFDVMSIPTLIVFKDGEAQKRLVGAKGKGQLLAELDEFLP